MIAPRLILFLTFAARLAAQTVTLDNFNQPGATGAVKNDTSWVNQVTRTAAAIVVGGTARDDSGWEAVNRQIDGTGMTHVTVTAQRDPGNLAPSLVVLLEDASLRTHIVSVSTSAFAVGALTTVDIPIGTWPAGFNPAQITGWSIGGGTPPLGTVAFRMTLDHLGLAGGAPPAPPIITAEPDDRVMGIGTSTTLSVVATGSGKMHYQWKKAGAPLAGATLATLDLVAVPLGASGWYQVDVTNSAGTTSSREARVTVLDATPAHGLAPGHTGYVAGSTLTIAHTLDYGGTATALRWQMLLPIGWTFVSDTATHASSRPFEDTQEVLVWEWTSPPATPLTFTSTVHVPIGSEHDAEIAALVTFSQDGATGDILVRPDPLTIRSVHARHSADTDGDFALRLIELTRVIELYNTRRGTERTGAYDVTTTGSEDGFAAAPGRIDPTATLARYHSADSNRDGRISLVELTRVIELYNTREGTVRTGRYHLDPTTEDGFAPGP